VRYTFKGGKFEKNANFLKYFKNFVKKVCFLPKIGCYDKKVEI